MNSKLYEMKKAYDKAKKNYKTVLKQAMQDALAVCNLAGDVMISKENLLAIAKKPNVKTNSSYTHAAVSDKQYYKGRIEVQTYNDSGYHFFFKSTEKHKEKRGLKERLVPYNYAQAYIRLTNDDDNFKDMVGFVIKHLGAYYEPFDKYKFDKNAKTNEIDEKED